MSETGAQPLQLGKVIGRIPSGLYIVTVLHENHPHAMMASWVQQASFQPPAISIAMARNRPMGETLRAAKQFALSILPEDDKTLMKHYVRPIDDANPFGDLPTLLTPSGIPILAGALAWLECRLLSTTDFHGDHELFIAEILAGAILKEGKPFTHVRGNGFRY